MTASWRHAFPLWPDVPCNLGRCDGHEIERRARRGRGGSGALACRRVQRGRGDQRHRERLRRGKTHPWAPVEAGQLYGEAAPAKAIPPEAVATIGGKAALKWKEWRAGFKSVSFLEPKPPKSAFRPPPPFADRSDAMPRARCMATRVSGLGSDCRGIYLRRTDIAVAFLAARPKLELAGRIDHRPARRWRRADGNPCAPRDRTDTMSAA